MLRAHFSERKRLTCISGKLTTPPSGKKHYKTTQEETRHRTFFPDHEAGRVPRREGADKHGAPPEQRNLNKKVTRRKKKQKTGACAACAAKNGSCAACAAHFYGELRSVAEQVVPQLKRQAQERRAETDTWRSSPWRSRLRSATVRILGHSVRISA